MFKNQLIQTWIKNNQIQAALDLVDSLRFLTIFLNESDS